jgi:hypothetical protein
MEEPIWRCGAAREPDGGSARTYLSNWFAVMAPPALTIGSRERDLGILQAQFPLYNEWLVGHPEVVPQRLSVEVAPVEGLPTIRRRSLMTGLGRRYRRVTGARADVRAPLNYCCTPDDTGFACFRGFHWAGFLASGGVL